MSFQDTGLMLYGMHNSLWLPCIKRPFLDCSSVPISLSMSAFTRKTRMCWEMLDADSCWYCQLMWSRTDNKRCVLPCDREFIRTVLLLKSVCMSLKRVHCHKTKKNFCPHFIPYQSSIDHPSFSTKRMIGG